MTSSSRYQSKAEFQGSFFLSRLGFTFLILDETISEITGDSRLVDEEINTISESASSHSPN